MAIAILGAFLLGLAWIGLIALGALLGWRGIRGHLIDQEPRCRRCGYSTRGLPVREAACPECGSPFVTGAVAFGRRRPLPKLIFAGLAIILIALSPLLIFVKRSLLPGAPAVAAARATGGAATKSPGGAAAPRADGTVAQSAEESAGANDGEDAEVVSGAGITGIMGIMPDATSPASQPGRIRERAEVEAPVRLPDTFVVVDEPLVIGDSGDRKIGDLLGASGQVELGWQSIEFDFSADGFMLLTPERLSRAMPESNLSRVISQPAPLRRSASSLSSLLTPFEPVAAERQLRFGGAAGPPELGSWQRALSLQADAEARASKEKREERRE